MTGVQTCALRSCNHFYYSYIFCLCFDALMRAWSVFDDPQGIHMLDRTVRGGQEWEGHLQGNRSCSCVSCRGPAWTTDHEPPSHLHPLHRTGSHCCDTSHGSEDRDCESATCGHDHVWLWSVRTRRQCGGWRLCWTSCPS